MLLRTDEPRDPAAVLLAATMRLRARAKGAGDDALNLDGYLLSGEWTSGKAKPVQGRLAADFTGWEQDVQNFNAKLPGGSRLQFLGGRFSSLARLDTTVGLKYHSGELEGSLSPDIYPGEATAYRSHVWTSSPFRSWQTIYPSSSPESAPSTQRTTCQW